MKVVSSFAFAAILAKFKSAEQAASMGASAGKRKIPNPKKNSASLDAYIYLGTFSPPQGW